MTDFKFSCPNCGQHIQCNDSYSGKGISCPGCQKGIVVPNAPGGAPPPAAHTAIRKAAVEEPAPQVAPPPSKPIKSKSVQMGSPAARKLFTALAGLIACGALGYFGWQFYLKREASKPKAPAVIAQADAPPTNLPPALTAAEIEGKVASLYRSLTNLSAIVKSVSVLDLSQVNPALTAPQTNSVDMIVKLGRTNLYRLEWKREIGPMVMQGGAWNCGEGDFVLMPTKKYAKVKNRLEALTMESATSGGNTAAGIVELFFSTTDSPSATKANDETLNGEECYVLTESTPQGPLKFWVNKNTFLIQQTQLVLGEKPAGTATTESAPPPQDSPRRNRRSPSPSPLPPAQGDAAAADIAAMISKVKGVLTDTWVDIQTNRQMSRFEFQCSLPTGAKQSSSLH